MDIGWFLISLITYTFSNVHTSPIPPILLTISFSSPISSLRISENIIRNKQRVERMFPSNIEIKEQKLSLRYQYFEQYNAKSSELRFWVIIKRTLVNSGQNYPLI